MFRTLLTLMILCACSVVLAAPKTKRTAKAPAKTTATAKASAAKEATEEAPAQPALPIIGWGVVTSAAPDAYDKTGKVMGQLKGGEPFDILKEVSINKAPAYYIQRRSKKAVKCILPGADCKVFMELPDPADENAVAGVKQIETMLSDYYSTLALRNDLLERAKAKHRKNSPAAKLEAAKAELKTVPAKDRKLEELQNKAKTNAERLKHQYARTELRYRTTGLQEDIKRLQAEADTWDAEHPFNDAAVKKTAIWRRLTQQLKANEATVLLFTQGQPAEE